MTAEHKIEFKAIKEDGTTIKVVKGGGTFYINNIPYTLDYEWIQKDRLHIIANHKNYIVNIVEIDSGGKLFTIEINHRIYKIILNDHFDTQLELMGLKRNTKSSSDSIKAPMPGLVVDLLVKENQEIKQGDNLLVLKAMKMENIIKSQADAKIKKILVKKDQTVEKDQELIILEHF